MTYSISKLFKEQNMFLSHVDHLKSKKVLELYCISINYSRLKCDSRTEPNHRKCNKFRHSLWNGRLNFDKPRVLDQSLAKRNSYYFDRPWLK